MGASRVSLGLFKFMVWLVKLPFLVNFVESVSGIVLDAFGTPIGPPSGLS